MGKTQARILAAALLSVSLIGLLIAAPTAAQEGGPTYVVQPGDTLFGIAFKFGTTVDALVEANSLADPSSIFPGQVLVIPGFPDVQGVLGTSSLSYGETLLTASLTHGIDAHSLGRLNRVVNPDRLYAGQDLIIPVSQEQPQGPLQSQRFLVEPGMGLLETAARRGVNPWHLQRFNQMERRIWLIPAELLHQSAEGPAMVAFPPGIDSVALDPEIGTQGRTMVVRLDYSGSRRLEGELGDRQLNLLPLGQHQMVAIQGIHALAEPSLVELSLSLLDEQGGEILDRYSQPVRIVAGDYGLEALLVPAETLDPEITGPEDQLIDAVVAQVTPEKLWSGLFSYPTSYYETFPSLFGTRRSYNGSSYSYYHTGLDLYGSTQTPVMAPASGIVALTETLTVRGNVTYIDHGWGVFSGFLHQSQILVEVGDRVEPGQVIGFVGGTGRVTGPHLHWEIWVGGIPVDPREWTTRQFP